MTAPSLPAETISISPEALEVANEYLQNPSIKAVSSILDIPQDTVALILDRKEVKAYIDRIFSESGYNNRTKMRDLLDTIIEKKLEEMSEAGIGSNKDIMDILALSHKFTMEHLDKEIALKKLEMGNLKPNNQFNLQINNDGSNYAKLLDKLMGGREIAGD